MHLPHKSHLNLSIRTPQKLYHRLIFLIIFYFFKKGVIIIVRRRHNWFPGAKYHITSRGIRRTSLFYDEEDFQKYLNLLEDTKNRYPFILHTYCLMTNHIHLQLETVTTPPGIIMRYLHTKYAKYFNKRYDYQGHVFENRYGAQWIDSADYELDVSKYIHLNPLKASMVQNLEDYPWSSYRHYVLGEKSTLISTNQILSYFHEPQTKNYETYMKSPYYEPVFDEDGKLIR